MPKPLTLLEGTLQHGTLLIGFERHHRIDRYPDPRRRGAGADRLP